MTGLSPTWQAYKAVVDDLMALRGQLAEVQIAEMQARHRTIQMSQDTSITGRKQEGDVAAAAMTEEVINVKMKIVAREDLRDMLRLAIEHGVEVVDGEP